MSHHGNTPAAWTGSAIALLGFMLGGIALMLSPVNMVLFWVGAALALVALPVFWVMARMGMNS